MAIGRTLNRIAKGLIDSRELSKEEVHILRHSLGLNNSRDYYRNYFATSEWSDPYSYCQSLVAKGFMERRKDFINTERSAFVFNVTPLGIAVAKETKEGEPFPIVKKEHIDARM
jgi:hypothetical protein